MRVAARIPYAALLAAVFMSVAETRAGSGTGLIISSAECRRLVTRHVPSPDVAYRPGQGVHGRAVAPADLDSAIAIRIPERIDIDILIPLEAFLGDETPPRTAEAEVRVGRVSVVGERLSYNGQPLADAAAAAVAAECRKALTRN